MNPCGDRSAKKSNNSNIAFVLENYNSSESKASEAKRKLDIAEPIPLTINNALEFLLENSLTKRLYNKSRCMSEHHNCDIYPRYHKVQDAKLQLRPKGITVTETMAKMSLPDLLNHTSSRIVQLQE